MRTKTPEKRKTAIIIGAGPAGLTAGIELLYNPYPFRGKGLRGRTFTYGLLPRQPYGHRWAPLFLQRP